MANVWVAVNTDDKKVAEFLSRDYDPVTLVDEHGRVTVYDQTDNMRFVVNLPVQEDN